MAYSLFDVVKDGPLTTTRLGHHLVKIATHGAATAFTHLLGLAWLPAALVGGPALFVLIVLHERIWPSDPQPLTAWQHWADWLNDGALAGVPVAAVLAFTGHALAGGLSLAAIVVLWAACHRDARP